MTLRIYDAGGRLVRTLVDGVQSAGHKSVVWDGRDDAGRAVASGVYFCRLTAYGLTAYKLTAPGFDRTHKMLLLK